MEMLPDTTGSHKFKTAADKPPPFFMFPLELRGEVNRHETRVMGIYSSEDQSCI